MRTIQHKSVKKKADATFTSLFFFLNTNEILNPTKKQKEEIETKTIQSVPPLYRSMTIGMIMYNAKKIKRFPIMNKEERKLDI